MSFTLTFEPSNPKFGKVSEKSYEEIPDGTAVSINEQAITLDEDLRVTAEPLYGGEFVRWDFKDSDGNPVEIPETITQDLKAIAIFINTPPQYCTVEDVEETLGLPDPNDSYGFLQFTEHSVPTRLQVERMIRANEDTIDRYLHRSFRENRVIGEMHNIDEYWHDSNGWRTDYYQRGGDLVQLHQNIMPWDPDKGDKLEIRSRSNVWYDITNNMLNKNEGSLYPYSGSTSQFWFDYKFGRMFITRTRFYQSRYNAIRITYRWGEKNDGIPAGITRMCALMTARNIIGMQAFALKVGYGGDISGIRDQMMSEWAREIAEIKGAFQRAGPVLSMYE